MKRVAGDDLHRLRSRSGGHRRRVVVIGAGFGGLATAQALVDAEVDIWLVDRKNHHCFQPLLYQVATASLSPADVAWPIRSIFSGQANVNVVMAEVVAIDPAAKQVLTADGMRLAYDDLVLATGATHSYFGHPEWEAVAPGLKTIEDATAIRARILTAFEKAETATDAAEAERLMTFVIIGGGPTGVELAGALADIAHNALTGDFRRINPSKARIVLVEAGPRLLAAFPEELSAYTETVLADMGVEVRTRTAVVGCDRDGVTTAAGARIGSRCVIWAAGVRASPAAGWLGETGDRAGRVAVDDHLRVPGFDNIYAIGDTASVVSAGAPVPGVAPAAKQMGRYVGRLIGAELAGQPAPGPFVYHDEGNLATIGRKAAVVSLGRIRLRGVIGWLFWSIAHVYFLIGVRHRVIVAVNWLWEYLTFRRGARLISK